MLKQRHQLLVTALRAADGVVILSSCAAAWAFRLRAFGEPLPRDWESWFKDSLAVYALPITLAVMIWLGMYRPRRDKSVLGETGQMLKACVVSLGVLVIGLWAVGGEFFEHGVVVVPNPRPLGWRLAAEPARLQLFVLACLMPTLLSVQRVAFRLGLRWMRRRGWNLRHVAIIGDGRLGQIACRTISRNSWTGLNVQYFVSHRDTARRRECMGRPVRGGLESLDATLEAHPVDAVYLALPNTRANATPEVLRRLERHAVDVRIVPDVHPRYLPQSMQVSELEGMPILSYRESPLYGLGGFSKRTLDLVLGSLALLVFGPAMVLIALMIRLGGPGPVIFRQKRVSLGGEMFTILKFRTMREVDDERSPAAWTGRDDPRVTRLGRWLRRTSLDELPQLFNVLKGDMSLVGPRPERPELIARFRDDWRGYMLRQHVKAGMTGWAQVNGLRGDTSLRKRLQYDLFYIRHWSVWFDVRILIATLFRGFMHPNAH